MAADLGVSCPVSVPPPVLIVEDWAHRPEGHFPRRFAELADAFAAEGCTVEVLTSRGWLYSGTAEAVRFSQNRYGPVARQLDRLANRLRDAGHGSRTEVLTLHAGGRLRVIALMGAARALRRRTHGPTSEVVVLSYGIDAVLAAAIAGPGRWLFYAFEAPSPILQGHGIGPMLRLAKWTEWRLAKWAERRRRARGGGTRIATPDETSRQLWEDIVPFLEPIVLPIAGCRARAPIPDACFQLGIASADRIALLFGSVHDKDYKVVRSAFSDLDHWRLMVGGLVADAFNLAEPTVGERKPILLGGFVSDGTRDLAYAAADLAILSFRADYQRNSGTLMDAIAWGVPVVCSERSAAAEIVRNYRLGVTFTPGDAQSLAEAVRRAPTRIEPEDLERARMELSNRAVARRHLQILRQLSEPCNN